MGEVARSNKDGSLVPREAAKQRQYDEAGNPIYIRTNSQEVRLAMAEFHFYGSDNDSRRIIDAIFDCGDMRLTPSLNYPTRCPKAFCKIEDGLLEAIAVNRRLYITGAFSRQPLRLQEVKGGKYDGTYVVEGRLGGPAMSISLPMCKLIEQNMYHLGPGNLFCHNVFWSDDGGEYKVPADVKAAYAALCKQIKSALERHRVGDKTFYIGKDGFQLLERGKAWLLENGSWIDASGVIVKSNLSRP